MLRVKETRPTDPLAPSYIISILLLCGRLKDSVSACLRDCRGVEWSVVSCVGMSLGQSDVVRGLTISDRTHMLLNLGMQ